MKLVLLESPFGNSDPGVVERNKSYARAAMHDCLVNHNEAPYASHLLYTQLGVLDDNIPEERTLGIEAGLIWGALAEYTVAYYDRGISKGMKYGLARAYKEGRRVEMRTLGDEWRDENSPTFYRCGCEGPLFCTACGNWGWLNKDILNDIAIKHFEERDEGQQS